MKKKKSAKVVVSFTAKEWKLLSEGQKGCIMKWHVAAHDAVRKEKQ